MGHPLISDLVRRSAQQQNWRLLAASVLAGCLLVVAGGVLLSQASDVNSSRQAATTGGSTLRTRLQRVAPSRRHAGAGFVDHVAAVAPPLYVCPFALEQITDPAADGTYFCGFVPLLTHDSCTAVLLTEQPAEGQGLAARLGSETTCRLVWRQLSGWQATGAATWDAAKLDGSNSTADGGTVVGAGQNSSWVDAVFVAATSSEHFGAVSALANRTSSQAINASQIILGLHAAVAAGTDETVFLRSIFDGFSKQGFRMTSLQPLVSNRSDAVSITFVKVGGSQLEPDNQRVQPWPPDTQRTWAFVIAHYNEDLYWLPRLQEWAPPGTPIELYTHAEAMRNSSTTVPGATAVRFVERNVGDEVPLYLSYLVDHHPHFADVTIFLHGHWTAWHSFDILEVLRHGTDTLGIRSYMSVNYVGDEFTGNSRADVSRRLRLVHRLCSEGLGPASNVEELAPGEEVFEGYDAIKGYWDDLWQQPMGDMPDSIVRDCCAQHAVTRPALLRYSKDTYQHWLDVVQTGNDTETHIGRIFEFMWRQIWTLPHEPMTFRETFAASNCRDRAGK